MIWLSVSRQTVQFINIGITSMKWLLNEICEAYSRDPKSFIIGVLIALVLMRAGIV